MLRSVLAIALLATSWCQMLNAGSPFDGTWKFNPAKSQLTGDTFTYSAAAAGKIHFSNGASYDYDFGLDGKPYPTPSGYTVTWVKDGELAWNTESSFEGRVVTKGHTALTPDGKQMTNQYIEFRPDGTTAKSSEIYDRVSGGPGLLGKWKNIQVEASSETLILSLPAPGLISYELPDFKVKISGPTDGSPIKPVGPTMPKDLIVTFKVVDPRTLRWESRLKDRATGIGTLALSEDGRTLFSISWTPGKEDEKTKSVYEKQ
jgi:hypothetical protein